VEVKLNLLGLKRFQELDLHSVLDVCGVGLKYLSGKQKSRESREEFKDLELGNLSNYEFGYNILRGIEVKVSRSDYKNGFICSGCNYNYVLAPMRMVAQYEVPSGVGLIEYNKHKFSCKLSPVNETQPHRRKFKLKGIRVVKNPVFRNVPQFQIDNAVSNILMRKLDSRIEKMEEEIIEFEDKLS
jgi:hypothetical protein